MARRRLDPGGQSNAVVAGALQFQQLDQAGLVLYAPAAAVVVEVEASELAFLEYLAGAVTGVAACDLIAFAGVQVQQVAGGVVLGEVERPAHAEARVLGVHRVEADVQGQRRAAEIVGGELRQLDAQRVLAGAGVDAVIDETQEVEGVGRCV
ncbi:hypothetical protein D3C81_1727780 [compost metagenome]